MSQTFTYKCANCGGEMVWEPDKALFVCEYCTSEFTEEEAKAASPQELTEADNEFAGQTDVYTCTSCGAEIFCDHATAATFCCYCHNPVSLKGRLTGMYRPDKIIPFKFGRDRAVEAFKGICRKKKFLPGNFLSEANLEKLTGLYVPFWVADCETDAKVMGRSVESHSVRRGDRTHVTENTYRHEREARFTFKDIPADASKRIDDATMDAVEPFDFNELRDFDMTYLSGFLCDKYDVEKLEVLPRIQTRVEQTAVELLTADMSGHGAVTVTEKNVRIIGVNWRYIMLPVWFMSYKYRGKDYHFALNGQTAVLAGKFPVSAGKLFLLGLILMSVITFIGTMMGGVL